MLEHRYRIIDSSPTRCLKTDGVMWQNRVIDLRARATVAGASITIAGAMAAGGFMAAVSASVVVVGDLAGLQVGPWLEGPGDEGAGDGGALGPD
jgi:hypothetical protein